MSRVFATAQAGLEGLRWLRDEAELGGRFSDQLKSGNLTEAGLVAIKGVANVLPRIDIRDIVPRFLEDEFDLIGVGAEAIVVRDGEFVHKYMTGKSQNPDALAERLTKLHSRASSHIGEILAPTSIEVVQTKLFKGVRAKDYVRLTQPYFSTEIVDPHLQPEQLITRPEITHAMRGFASGLTELFVNEGLLMDIVNTGNLVWGNHGGNQETSLYMIDTIPVDYSSMDFTGIKVPFWNPSMHLEYLADFVNMHSVTTE